MRFRNNLWLFGGLIFIMAACQDEPSSEARDAGTGFASDLGVMDAARDLTQASDLGTDATMMDQAFTPDAMMPRDAMMPDLSDLRDAMMPGDEGFPDLPDMMCSPEAPAGPDDPLVSTDACTGALRYGLYANLGQDDAVHRVPDFSFAGYMGGGVAIPDTFARVASLAPDADDASDHERIQAALDAAGQLTPDARGIRGEVHLEAGTFELDAPLQITHDGVILSGAGQDPDAGTLIVARQRSQHTVIQVIGAGSGFGVKRDASSVQAITSERVAVGATSFELADASGFSVGDAILVTRTPNQAWIDLLGMAEFGWTPESYHIDHERQITAISGNTVTVDTPIVDGMEQVYGGGEVSLITEVEAVRQVGVQDLWIRSEFDGSNPEDEDHAWIGISFERTRDSWVQRVTGEHLAYATISFTRSARHNTAQEVAFVDPVSEVTGGRRYPFNISGSGNLIQRCYSSKGRHNFVAGARVAGPNVWLDCLAVKSTNDDGPHHRWSSGLLYDNTRSAVINVQNRKSSGSGHGWVGSQIMFWNGMADTMTVDAPRAGMNWAVGMDAELQESRFSPEESVGTVESTGLAVTPRSLYLAQLQDRLGAAVVASIATPEQLQGRIWRQLYAWRGRGLLADTTPIAEIPEACPGGVRSGNICCAAQCGECGGSGCSVRPGGSAQCCSSPIRDSGILCEDSGMAPCLISD